MKIESGNARISTARTNDGHETWADVRNELSGYAFTVSFMKDYGFLAICKRKDDHIFLHIVALPSEEWKKDLEDAGYEIVQILTKTKESKP